MKDSPPEHSHETGSTRSQPLPSSVTKTPLSASPLSCPARRPTSCVKQGPSLSTRLTSHNDVLNGLCSRRSREQTRPTHERKAACSASRTVPLSGYAQLCMSAVQHAKRQEVRTQSTLLSCYSRSPCTVETIETVMTCEGDLNSPHFKRRFAALKARLTRLLKTSRRSLNIKKIEPWNSVKVTMQLPRRLAEKLKKLAENDGELLRSLGVLGIQVQGDRHINLQLSNPASQPSGSSAQSQPNNIVSIINQLVGASAGADEGVDQHAPADCSSASSSLHTMAPSGIAHQPNCAFLLRRVHVESDAKACDTGVQKCEDALGGTYEQPVSSTDDDDQVVCTCGASSASLTPASSSNSATSVNAFTVPVNTGTDKQPPRRRRNAPSECCALTLPGPSATDSGLSCCGNDANSECNSDHRSAASNGCAQEVNCFVLSPFSGEAEKVNGSLDRHSNGPTEPVDPPPVVTPPAVLTAPPCSVTRSPSLNSVPASLSNFAAEFTRDQHSAASSSSLFFTLNDDNILDDSLACPGPGPVRPDGPDEATRPTASSELDAFVRPMRPQAVTVNLLPANAPRIATTPLVHTVLEKGDKVQIIRLPARSDVRQPFESAFDQTSRVSAVRQLVRTGADHTTIGNNQVRIIQIASKTAANNHGAGTNSKPNVIQNACLGPGEAHSNNGVLSNGTHESNSGWPASNKRIRIEANSHPARSSSSDCECESDEDVL